jgi:hypothetical protein
MLQARLHAGLMINLEFEVFTKIATVVVTAVFPPNFNYLSDFCKHYYYFSSRLLGSQKEIGRDASIGEMVLQYKDHYNFY